MNTGMKATTDALGVEIRVGDTVTVVSYGARIRLGDVGRRAIVIGFTRAGNIQLVRAGQADPIAGGAAVCGGFLAVARRDGSAGHQGNSGELLVPPATDLTTGCIDCDRPIHEFPIGSGIVVHDSGNRFHQAGPSRGTHHLTPVQGRMQCAYCRRTDVTTDQLCDQPTHRASSSLTGWRL